MEKTMPRPLKGILCRASRLAEPGSTRLHTKHRKTAQIISNNSNLGSRLIFMESREKCRMRFIPAEDIAVKHVCHFVLQAQRSTTSRIAEQKERQTALVLGGIARHK